MAVQIYGGVKPGAWWGLHGKGEDTVSDVSADGNVGLKIDTWEGGWIAPEGIYGISTKVDRYWGGKFGVGQYLSDDKKTSVGVYLEGGRIGGVERPEYSDTRWYGTGVSVGTKLATLSFGVRNYWDQAEGHNSLALGGALSFSWTFS